MNRRLASKEKAQPQMNTNKLRREKVFAGVRSDRDHLICGGFQQAARNCLRILRIPVHLCSFVAIICSSGIVVLLPLLVASCSVLEPKPDNTRNYLLSPESVVAGAARDVSLAVGPITLPPYLDRAELVTRVRSHRVEILSNHRWAEPLDVNFTRVFTANLAAAVGTDRVVEFPWLVKPKVDYRVTVDVERFETTSEGFAVLLARWSLSRGVDGELARSKRSSFEVPIDGGTTEDSVAALSRAVALLAEEIAKEISPPT